MSEFTSSYAGQDVTVKTTVITLLVAYTTHNLTPSIIVLFSKFKSHYSWSLAWWCCTLTILSNILALSSSYVALSGIKFISLSTLGFIHYSSVFILGTGITGLCLNKMCKLYQKTTAYRILQFLFVGLVFFRAWWCVYGFLISMHVAKGSYQLEFSVELQLVSSKSNSINFIVLINCIIH